jgi:hypothetical protein
MASKLGGKVDVVNEKFDFLHLTDWKLLRCKEFK